jgi:hypothetical protein
MKENQRPESILELLTKENPTVTHGETKSKTLTQSSWWWTPQQLQPWTEFSYETLSAVFNGRLLAYAREERCQLPDYPYLHPRYCKVSNEGGTRDLIMKWNHTIVSAALDFTDPEFSPAFWVGEKGDSESDREDEENEEGGSSFKKKTQKSKKKKMRKKKRVLFPDGGAGAEAQGEPLRGERLPKDYKPALKWRSQMIFENNLVDRNGMWKERSNMMRMEVRPIRQVYTYCISRRCRYGCILTTKEIFIFRISPRVGAKRHSKGIFQPFTTFSNSFPVNTRSTTRTGVEDLERSLINDGLMEYISIPWENHNNGDSLTYNQLTINLATWFIHVLAGNNHEVDWWYPALRLTGSTHKGPVADPPQESSLRPIGSFSKKRRREEENQEPIYPSFSPYQPLVMQVRACPCTYAWRIFNQSTRK